MRPPETSSRMARGAMCPRRRCNSITVQAIGLRNGPNDLPVLVSNGQRAPREHRRETGLINAADGDKCKAERRCV